eukprot:TRINITY_DN3207_c0_g1_i6.p1 TRINITY_DN3207_c0_g1~~TRINITY_DN3207_c0_g1_i6.p1  ORF type:complete len:318 (+),score=74.16 TRINITY_DN3207_c0_g1_i6:903-1856(+)
MLVLSHRRPGVSEFLASASKLYEIYVFTLGARDYGRRIAEIIDPGFKYLDESKVFTVEDAGGDKRILQKRLDCILPFDYNMVVIVDDRIDVWSAHEDNVLQVRKFVFFPPGRPSDSETKRSREGTRGPPIECNSPGSGIEDNALPRFSNLLKQVHDLYYGHTEHGAINNTQECIDIVLSEVLSGVTILFSGVFNLKNDPRENWLWKRAEKYGAECSLEWSDDVTHLVAFKDGSQKVHEASEKSVFIVSLNWLHFSFQEAKRADELAFYLNYEKNEPRYRDHNKSVRQHWKRENELLQNDEDAGDEEEQQQEDESLLE